MSKQKLLRREMLQQLDELNIDEIKKLTHQYNLPQKAVSAGLNIPDTTNPEKSMRHLENLLLSIGGNKVILPNIETDLNNIILYGQLWIQNPKIIHGEPCQCHANACNLWFENRSRALIATGYALSKDGIWRQHSWLIFPHAKSNAVVETTTKRIAYFGYVMTTEMCYSFDFWNT